MTIRQFIKKLFVTIIMIGIVLAAVLKVGYILICKVIVVIIFVVLAIQYWVGEDIRKAEEEKRGTWLFTLGFIGLTVLTMLAANIPGQVQRDQYLYLTKEHTEQLEKVLLREATSALDVTTERKVLRNIIEQKPNKTCIVTTHRPSVLNMCQRVYRVMETKVTELDEEESSRMAIDF